MGGASPASASQEKLAPQLREMKELEARQESAQKALRQYAACDPDRFRALREPSPAHARAHLCLLRLQTACQETDICSQTRNHFTLVQPIAERLQLHHRAVLAFTQRKAPGLHMIGPTPGWVRSQSQGSGSNRVQAVCLLH